MYSHDELCTIGERYLSKTYGCKVTAKEPRTQTVEEPDVIGFKMGYSYLLEAKTSRSDFFADKKKPFRKHPDQGMGDYRYFICETDLIKVEDLPPKWGLIYVSEKGRARIVTGQKKNSYQKKWKFNKNINAEWHLLFSLARRICYSNIVVGGDWRYPGLIKKGEVLKNEKANIRN